MDPNPNQHRDTDSSHSLHLLTTTGSGILRLRRTKWMKRNDNNSKQIDELSNKFLVTIFNKLTWSQLAHLRVVCKRWRAVVHSMGEEKKLLIVNYDGYEQARLDRSFFGALDFDNCAHVNLRNISPTSSFGALIVGLFPSVDQFVFKFDHKYPIDILFKLDFYLLSPKIASLSLTVNYDCLEKIAIDLSKESHRIANRINQLASLKHVQLVGQFATLVPLIVPTLHRVDHFSYSNSCGETTKLAQLVRQFGRNCTRFALHAPSLPYSRISRWLYLNPDWLARLTHLQLMAHITKFNQLAQFLSVNAVSLRVFRFEADPITNRVNQNRVTLTRQAMDDLSRLVHLIELELSGLFFISNHPDGSFGMNSRPLVNVRTCTLHIDCHNTLTGDGLSQILSPIFPNVQHLDIAVKIRSTNYHAVSDFEQYLDRFPALCTHKFVHEERLSTY